MLALMSLALPLMAQEHGPNDRVPPLEKVAGFLELSEEQVGDWQALLEDRDEALVPLHEEIAAESQALGDLLAGEDPDATEVGELVIAIHDLRGEAKDVHMTYATGFDELLEEEQAQRLEFIRRANHIQPLLPAFKAMGLIR
jgi:Spy/CpxP family protein refolding chaperone